MSVQPAGTCRLLGPVTPTCAMHMSPAVVPDGIARAIVEVSVPPLELWAAPVNTIKPGEGVGVAVGFGVGIGVGAGVGVAVDAGVGVGVAEPLIGCSATCWAIMESVDRPLAVVIF